LMLAYGLLLLAAAIGMDGPVYIHAGR